MTFAVALAYAAVATLAFGSSLFPGRALSGGDWETVIYPFYAFCSEIYRVEGRLPFWNPYIFAGLPHLVSLNTCSLYPTELLSFAFGMHPATFYALDLIVHLCAAGLGVYAWLRIRGMQCSSAFTGGLCYILGNNMLTQGAGGHPHWVRGMALLPWILLCIDMGKSSRCWKWLAAAGAMLGVIALGGAMHFVVCATAVILVWVMMGSRPGTSSPESRPGLRIAQLLILGLCALGMGALVLLPGFQYYLHSVRIRPTGVFQGSWSFTLWDILDAGFPGLLGERKGYYGPQMFRVTGDYLGLFPICLAGLGIVTCWRRELAVISLGAVSLILAFGPSTSLGAGLATIPIFSGLRSSSRWFSIVHLAVSVLAARGWGSLIEKGPRRSSWRWMPLICTVMACSCVIGLILASPIAESLARREFVRHHLAAMGADEGMVLHSVRQAFIRGVVCSTASAALFALARGHIPLTIFSVLAWLFIVADLQLGSSPFFIRRAWSTLTAPTTAAAAVLSRGAVQDYRVVDTDLVLNPNQQMFQKINSLLAYHGLPMLRTTMLSTVALGPPERGSSEMMTVLNVRCALRPLMAWEEGKRLTTASGTSRMRYELVLTPDPLGPAFLSERVLGCASVDEVIFAFQFPGWKARVTPIDGQVPLSLRGHVLPTTGIVSVMESRETPEVDVSLHEPGFLVFSRAWYPAWVAFVDGGRATVLRAYGALCGVEVPAGRHVVRLSYESVLFKLGLLISSATAIGLLCLVWLEAKRDSMGNRIELATLRRVH